MGGGPMGGGPMGVGGGASVGPGSGHGHGPGADWLSNDFAGLSLFDGRLSSSMPGLAEDDISRAGAAGGGNHNMAGMDFFGGAGPAMDSKMALFHEHDGGASFGLLGGAQPQGTNVSQPHGGSNGRQPAQPVSTAASNSKPLDSLSEHQGWPAAGSSGGAAPQNGNADLRHAGGAQSQGGDPQK